MVLTSKRWGEWQTDKVTSDDEMLRLQGVQEKMREDIVKDFLSVKKSVSSLFSIKDVILSILLLIVLYKQFL